MLAVLVDIVTTSTCGRVEACCTSRYSHHEYSRTGRGLLYQQIQSSRVLADGSKLDVLVDIVTTSTRVLADRSRLAVLADIVITSTRGRVEACCTSRYSHHEYSRTGRSLMYQQIQSPRVLADGSMLAVLADIVTTSTRVLADRSMLAVLADIVTTSTRVLADGSMLAVLADIVITSTRGRVEACCTSRYSHHEYLWTGRCLLYQQIQSSRVLADGSRLAVLADIVTTSTRGRVEACCTSRYSHHEYSSTGGRVEAAVLADIVTTSTGGQVKACCTSRYSHHEYLWMGLGLLYQQIQSPRILVDGSRFAVLVDIVTTSTCGWVQACCTSRYSHHEYSWTSRGLLYQQIQSSRVLEYWRTGRGFTYKQIQSPRVLEYWRTGRGLQCLMRAIISIHCRLLLYFRTGLNIAVAK